jgi:hypothetical protein
MRQLEQQGTQKAARAPETIETSAAEGMLTTEETLSTAVMVTTSGTSKQRL